MTLDHHSDSRDIAGHTRQQLARDAMGTSGPWAHPPRDPVGMTGFRVVLFVVAGIAFATLGYLTAPDVSINAPSDDFVNCYEEGC